MFSIMRSRIYPSGHKNPSEYCFALHMHFKLPNYDIIRNNKYEEDSFYNFKNVKIRFYNKIFD
jgi:hypothetical protein